MSLNSFGAIGASGDILIFKILQMKTRILFFSLSFMCTLSAFIGCSNNEEDTKTEKTITRSFIKTIKDVEGLVAYNNSLQRWFVMCDYPHTYDSVDNDFPLEIEDEYKVPGLRVIISGNVYGEVPNLPLLGGHENYYIELLKIEKAE